MHVFIRISCCLSVCICIDTTTKNISRESAELGSRAALYFVVVTDVIIIIVDVTVTIVILVVIVIIVILVVIVIVVIIILIAIVVIIIQ